ncbi:hypothetical protein JCM10450v2_005268 [Rhodotorula kratochvilovae]
MPTTVPQTRCSVCDSSNSRRCGPCAAAGFDLFFCSPEHQKLVWKTHKQVCGANSSPFMPPDLPPPEEAKLRSLKLDASALPFPSLPHKDYKTAAGAVWRMVFGDLGKPRTMKTSGHLLVLGTELEMLPEIKQAVVLQAYTQLYRLDVSSDRLRSPSLNPFHHASALYTALRLLHPGFTDLGGNNRLLHALLTVFTLAQLETRAEGAPAEYDKVYLLDAVRHVVATLSTSGICVSEMGDTFKLLQESLAGVARLQFDVSSGGGAKQVGIRRLGPP